MQVTAFDIAQRYIGIKERAGEDRQKLPEVGPLDICDQGFGKRDPDDPS